jgi:hypothetical protein
MGLSKNITGFKFGKLVALEPTDKFRHRSTIWLCKCDCGNTHEVPINDLTAGKVKSCGCNHNMSGTRFHSIWASMKNRCLNIANLHYPYYGGRGITCTEYLEFIPFMQDHYESYLKACEELGEKNVTIDRINVDGNYEKENIRWVTTKVQNSNKTTNKKFKAISPTGEEFVSNNQKHFSIEHNLQQQNIHLCLKGINKQHKGWKFNYLEAA